MGCGVLGKLLSPNIPSEAISDGEKETENNEKNIEDGRHSTNGNRGS